MAIDELLDEHEQSERVRRWVRENGLGLIGGVVLGLALVGGWKWWQSHQQGQREADATRYDGLQNQLKAINDALLEPGDVPDLMREPAAASATPRLDALLGDNQG